MQKFFLFACSLYFKHEFQDIDEDELYFALFAQQHLQCCTTDKRGKTNGDPVILIFLGNLEDLVPAFVRRDWHLAEETYWGSIKKTTGSFLFGKKPLCTNQPSLCIWEEPGCGPSEGLKKIGFVRGVGNSTKENPEHNLTGDPYFTDGMQAVLAMDHQKTLINNVQFFNWNNPSEGEISPVIQKLDRPE